MNGFKQFESAISDKIVKIVRLTIENHYTELDTVLQNQLFDISGPAYISVNRTQEELFIAKVYYGFTEIRDSFATLKNCEIYIKRLPFPEFKVSKLSYLRFVIESYLNEMYILKLRLDDYLKILQRAYRKSSRNQDIHKLIKPLSMSISKMFKNINSTRGSHVHKSRYADQTMHKLSLLKGLSSRIHNVRVTNYYKLQCEKFRMEWTKTMKQNHKEIQLFLDQYFEELFKVVFTKNSEIIYP